MRKMPLPKVPPARLTWITILRRSGLRLFAFRTLTRSAALVTLVALMALISFPSSSASSMIGLLHPAGPGPSTTSNASRSAAATKRSFRASIKAASHDDERTTAELNIARKAHTATTLLDGRILIAGGENSSGEVEDSEVYDPNPGSFSLSAKLNIARANHTATRLADGRIIIIGGHNRDGSLKSTEFFDSQSNSFSPGPSLVRARSGHTATTLADGRILIAGGDYDGTAEIFDPANLKFSRLKGRLAAPRSSHSAILLKSGEVLIAGGISTQGGELRSGELFDPETLQFTPTRNMSLAVRIRPMLRLLPDGKVQVIGGDDQRSMEMFNTEGRYFTARAQILPDSNSQTSIEEVMRAPSRAALINNRGSLSTVAGVGTSGLPIMIEDPLDKRETLARLLDRSEHTITDLPDALSTLVTGGISSSGATLISTMTTSNSSATVTTDKTDYQPGETVIISGTNWQAGETVQLTLHRDNNTPDTVLTAVADQEGNISNSEYLVQESDLNVAFLLTAVGQTSGYTAQTTFTDSRTINSVSLNGRSSVTVSPGATITVVIFVSTSVIGGTNWRSTSWRIATTPPGTTTCVDHPNHDAVGFFGEVLSITAPTSAGVYNAYFTAFQENDCTIGPSTVFVMTNAVTVVQTCAAPTITCPAAVNVQCDSNVPAPATDLASFVSQGGTASPSSPSCGPVSVTLMGESSSGSCPKTITRTYRASDSSGNQATCTQTITVHDTTAPSVSCPPPVTVQCAADVPAHATDLAGLVSQGGSASDNCGVPTVTFVSDVSSGSCPKTITRTYRATDGCGNSTECTQTITVNDTTAPSITCPAAITVQCDANVPPHATDLASLVTQGGNASDNCGVPEVTFVSDVATGSCPKTIIRTYRATDACGNSRDCTQTITVHDTIAPIISCPPPVTVQCDADVPAPATNLAGLVAQLGNASDNCGTPTVTFVGDVPSGSCPRIIARTYRATDACGNQSTCTQLITVVDTIAPTITCPSDIAVQSSDSGDAAVDYELPTATDNCVTPSVVCSPPSGSIFRIGVTLVTCTATDACGNSSSCSFSVGVRYDFFGFFSPIENPPLSNRVKAGQTIPLKFRLKAGQNLISDLAALMNIESAKLAGCLPDRTGPPVDERESSAIHYDSVENQFVINWRTNKKWAYTCRKLIVTLNDGSVHMAYFEFVK